MKSIRLPEEVYKSLQNEIKEKNKTIKDLEKSITILKGGKR